MVTVEMQVLILGFIVSAFLLYHFKFNRRILDYVWLVIILCVLMFLLHLNNL